MKAACQVTLTNWTQNTARPHKCCAQLLGPGIQMLLEPQAELLHYFCLADNRARDFASSCLTDSVFMRIGYSVSCCRGVFLFVTLHGISVTLVLSCVATCPHCSCTTSLAHQEYRYVNNKQEERKLFYFVIVTVVLKGHCHDIWQLYKKLEGVFASIEFQNQLVIED